MRGGYAKGKRANGHTCARKRPNGTCYPKSHKVKGRHFNTLARHRALSVRRHPKSRSMSRSLSNSLSRLFGV